MQMQTLVDSLPWRDANESSHRMTMFYSVKHPPFWVVENELIKILKSVGSTKTALDLSLKLQLWEEVIDCYHLLDLRHKAVEVGTWTVYPKKNYPQTVYPEKVYPGTVCPETVCPETVYPGTVYPETVYPQRQFIVRQFIMRHFVLRQFVLGQFVLRQFILRDSLSPKTAKDSLSFVSG